MRNLAIAASWIAFSGALSAAPDVAPVPILFEQARAANGPASYLARGRGYSLSLEAGGIELRGAGGSAEIRFSDVSAPGGPEIAGEPAARVNTYVGPRSAWRSGAPAWRQVRYRAVYPGIDLVFYGRDGVLEYDAVVKPGGNPGQIAFDFRDARTGLTAAGDLEIQLGASSVTWHRPAAYQQIDGRRVPVEAAFVRRGRRVGFRLGRWDRRYELIIDPTLSFATYLGGSGNEMSRGVAVDASGNVYIAGATASGDLPVTASSFQSAFKGGDDYGNPSDGFVAKLNSNGTGISYITYLGGTGVDWANAITVDSAGNAFVAGLTDSNDFPVTTGAFQTRWGGDGGDDNPSSTGDGFVAKFDPTGKLVWSTYLGGGQDDAATSIVLDSAGNVVVAGATTSTNFPVSTTAYQSRFGGGTTGHFVVSGGGYAIIDSGDAFISKLDPTGTKLLSGTYLGGSGDDIAISLALDNQGNIWAGGATASSNFPVSAAAVQSKFAGSSNDNLQAIVKFGDGFVAELSPDLSKVMYATYLGGSNDDAVMAIAIDSAGAIFAAGFTQSSNFPVKGASAGSYKGPAQPANFRPYMLGDAFLAKLTPASGLLFSEYIGGRDDDTVGGMVLDGQGNPILAGMTNSSDFPVTSDAAQAKLAGSGASPYDGVGDGFVMQVNGATGATLYSTFVGGSSYDILSGVAISSNGNVYATGYSGSSNFPVTAGAVQKSLNAKNAGTSDAVILRYTFASANGPSIGGVANSASYSTAAYSPGEIVTVFGQNMGPAAVTTAAIDPRTGGLATTLGGAQILFDGQAAPLIYVSATQASVVIPYEVAGKTSTAVTVSYGGAISAPVSLKVGASAPGLFSINQQGTGQGAIVNQDNTFNSAANPAPAGTYIAIYGTGEGQLTPPGVTGSLAPSAAPFPQIAGNLSITVGGAAVPASAIVYAGPVPGFVEGEFQINLQLPPNVPSGNQPLVVTINGTSSLNSYTVAVK